LAFDNEQKEQKNYLDRGYNTVVFHTVTSFVAFYHDRYDNIQTNTNSWLYSKLTQKQCEDLLYLNSDIKNEIHKELVKYLTTLLKELCIEKSQEKNEIDKLVYH